MPWTGASHMLYSVTRGLSYSICKMKAWGIPQQNKEATKPGTPLGNGKTQHGSILYAACTRVGALWG